MNWIKKNPAPFALALVSVGSLGLVGMLYSKVSEFPNGFSTPTPVQNDKVEAAELASVEAAASSLAAPAKWSPGAVKGSIFVAKKHIEKDGKLVNPETTDFPLHPPVENKWILSHDGLSIASPTVLTDDADGDGFSNQDEWNGVDALSHLILPPGAQALQPVMNPSNAALPADSTNPSDPKSHPAYLTKLRLIAVKQVPFRMILKSIDGKVDNKKEMTFFVNAVDRGAKTVLLQIGQTLPSDPRYKLSDFRPKIEKNADGTETDNSELIIINTEYQEELALPLNKVVDSPESYAVFRYLWKLADGTPTADFAVKKNGEFTLQPEADKKYKLLKFGTTSVDVKTPTGETVTIPVSN